MRKAAMTLVIGAFVFISSCGRERASTPVQEPARDARQQSSDIAEKAGEAAYKLKEKSEDAAKKAGSAIKRGAKSFGKGWKKAREEDRKQGR
jgi:hypothetical protein